MIMKTPQEYKEQLNALYTNFEMGLYNITKSYPLYKIYPNNNSYKHEYFRDLKNLEEIKSNIFIYKNGLYADTESISDSISDKNNKITKLNKQNTELTKKLNTLENQDFAANVELINKKFIYNKNLAQNVILSIIVAGSIGWYAFKSRTIHKL